MADFFKQLIAQLTAIWQRLSIQQKIITSSLVAFTFLGLVGLLLWTRSTASASSGGETVLYSDLEVEDAAAVTDKLQQGGYKYKMDNNGRSISVSKKDIYEVRMALAREGLPKSHGIGYELFDKTNFGMTDFVQKLNSRRALEGELQRTIEGLEEVKSSRVHLSTPEPSLFLDEQKEAKASVVVKLSSGRELSKDQIRGITYLVSASVEGLKPQNISIVDYNGRLLSSPFNEDETALASSQNLELQQNVERALERKIDDMMTGVLGQGKSKARVSLDLDFDRTEATLEKYNPESRVIRSEERTDENTKNAPDGDQTREHSITNYEIDKSVEHVMREVGNIKRLTISVAVDGRYTREKNGKETYMARTTEELQQLEEMVKNTVGYDLARGDEISVANVQFDNEFLRKEQTDMEQQERLEFYMTIAKYAGLFIIALFFILFLRYLAKTLAEAMNPPVPSIAQFEPDEPVAEEIPQDMRRSSEILERVEMLTREEPVNIAGIIRQWLNEPGATITKKKSK